MWLFAEFLPELMMFFKKTKDNANNPVAFFLFLTTLLLLFYIFIFTQHYLYGLIITIISGALLYIITKDTLNSLQTSDFSLDLNIPLEDYYYRFPIKFRDLFRGKTLPCDISNKVNLKVILGSFGEYVYILIDGKKIETLPLYPIQVIFGLIVFQRLFKDASGRVWLMKVRIVGLIRFKVEVVLKQVGDNVNS